MTTLFASILAAILGLVEGATEFIPVSSSGHLILVREVLEHYFATAATFLEQNAMAFDAVLQLAAIFAVLIYFRADVVRLLRAVFLWLSPATPANDKAQVVAVIVGTIPGVVAGLFLENIMETVLRAPFVVAAALLAGSVLMLLAEKSFSRRDARENVGATSGADNQNKITVKTGFAIGLFQMLALVPGFSRSGATISGGLLLGMSREEAARFSFILSLPIIAGSGAKKLIDLVQSGVAEHIADIAPLLVGGLVAFVVGFVAIAFLMRYLRTHSMKPFVWYRVALAAVIVLVVFA